VTCFSSVRQTSDSVVPTLAAGLRRSSRWTTSTAPPHLGLAATAGCIYTLHDGDPVWPCQQRQTIGSSRPASRRTWPGGRVGGQQAAPSKPHAHAAGRLPSRQLCIDPLPIARTSSNSQFPFSNRWSRKDEDI
jgi:hypothetical protein